MPGVGEPGRLLLLKYSGKAKGYDMKNETKPEKKTPT